MVVVSSLVAQSIFGLLQILGWNSVSIVYEKDTYEGMFEIICGLELYLRINTEKGNIFDIKSSIQVM